MALRANARMGPAPSGRSSASAINDMHGKQDSQNNTINPVCIELANSATSRRERMAARLAAWVKRRSSTRSTLSARSSASSETIREPMVQSAGSGRTATHGGERNGYDEETVCGAAPALRKGDSLGSSSAESVTTYQESVFEEDEFDDELPPVPPRSSLVCGPGLQANVEAAGPSDDPTRSRTTSTSNTSSRRRPGRAVAVDLRTVWKVGSSRLPRGCYCSRIASGFILVWILLIQLIMFLLHATSIGDYMLDEPDTRAWAAVSPTLGTITGIVLAAGMFNTIYVLIFSVFLKCMPARTSKSSKTARSTVCLKGIFRPCRRLYGSCFRSRLYRFYKAWLGSRSPHYMRYNYLREVVELAFQVPSLLAFSRSGAHWSFIAVCTAVIWFNALPIGLLSLSPRSSSRVSEFARGILLYDAMIDLWYGSLPLFSFLALYQALFGDMFSAAHPFSKICPPGDSMTRSGAQCNDIRAFMLLGAGSESMFGGANFTEQFVKFGSRIFPMLVAPFRVRTALLIGDKRKRQLDPLKGSFRVRNMHMHHNALAAASRSSVSLFKGSLPDVLHAPGMSSGASFSASLASGGTSRPSASSSVRTSGATSSTRTSDATTTTLPRAIGSFYLNNNNSSGSSMGSSENIGGRRSTRRSTRLSVAVKNMLMARPAKYDERHLDEEATYYHPVPRWLTAVFFLCVTAFCIVVLVDLGRISHGCPIEEVNRACGKYM